MEAGKSRRDFLKIVGLVPFVAEINNREFADNQYDLIVVGAGTAGIPCAIAAAEKGAKVLVIEKAEQVGGTLHLTSGHMSAGGTKHQMAHKTVDTPQAHFDDVMRISKKTAPEALVRLATDEAPKTIDWLDSLGFEFAPESPLIDYGQVPYQVARTQFGKEAGKSILKVLLPQYEKYTATGHINTLLNHKLVDLLKKGSKVIGVKVANEVGEKDYLAKSVVLTTGGYAANSTMFAEKHVVKNRLVSSAALTSMGEGIQVAEKHGAQFWNADKHNLSLGGLEEEPNSGRADFLSAWVMVSSTLARPAKEIYVNSYGVRFMDESNPDPDYRENIVSKQPGAKFWIVFDQNILFQNPNNTLVAKWDYNRLYQEAFRGRCVWYGNNIEELGKKTGLPIETLKRTLADYNQMVAEGLDIDFNRTKESLQAMPQGPYFAVLTYASSLVSYGGLAINEKLQVLDKQNKPIPNLYAAGEIIGAGATTGNTFCSGMLLTPALSFGRLLGKLLV